MLENLTSLLDDSVTDVFVSPTSGVWIHRGTAVERSSLELTEEDVRALAVELIDRGGRHLDDASPCVDVALDGGVRVHAVLWPVSAGGTEVSIRIPARQRPALESFREEGAMSPQVESALRSAVAGEKTILVTGSAGAGKTTLLRALLELVPQRERIVVIEDVAELRLAHPRAVGLETRVANVERIGEIGVAELIRQSLRMRPDRLVVGECRGADVVDMFIAFTTGHAGGGSTLHASSLSDVATRLGALCALAGVSDETTTSLALAAIDLVAHIDRVGSERSIVLGRPRRNDSGQLVIEPVEDGGVGGFGDISSIARPTTGDAWRDE